MKITYDVALRSFSFDGATSEPYGANLTASLNRHGQVIAFAGLSFGVAVRRNGVEALNVSFPPGSVVYRSTDQDALLAVRVAWLPDEVIAVSVWMTNNGATVEGAHSFTVPRPVAPYPSWVWGAGAWEPPLPYPGDGQAYDWDEASGLWVLAT